MTESEISSLIELRTERLVVSPIFFIDAKAYLLFVSFFLRLCSEVPLLEDTLMRILVIGLSRDLPLGPADAMELADHLVKRAAGVQSDGKTALLVRMFERSTHILIIKKQLRPF